MAVQRERIAKQSGLLIWPEGQPAYRAHPTDSGIEVWEITRTFRELGESLDALIAHYTWLTEEQLRCVLDFAREHPLSVDERLAEEDHAAESMERLWRDYPATRPPAR